MQSIICGSGSYLPENLVTNDELAKTVETNDLWVQSRTGIKQRYIAKDGELTSHMAANAAQKAIDNAKIDKQVIDLIIVATTTADRTFPATAVNVQKILEIEKCAAFDVQAVCAGFIYALTTANCFIKSGQAKNILVIGADKMSSIVDWNDRKTCILFGDGAGAVIVSASDNSESGIIATDIESDGRYQDILQTDGGIGLSGTAGKVRMEGQEVFKHAVSKMSGCVKNLLKENSLSTNDINYLIPHQANSRIMEMVAKKLRIEDNRVISTVDQHANTSAASIPLAIDYANQNGLLKSGDLIAFTAIGGGLAWGAGLVRW